MRKLPVYFLTAATALAAAGAAPATAFAATGTYNIPGSKMIVIGGSLNGGMGGMNGIPGGIGNISGGMGSLNDILGSMDDSNCTLPGIPGISIPGSNIPGNMLPSQPGNPIPDQPGDMLPGQPSNPIPDQPGNMLPNQPSSPAPNQPETGGSQDAFANQVVDLVNKERTKAGLPALTVDSGAAAAAQTRAKEIVSSFSHTRPDGSAFSTALSAAGVNYTGAGENIAYGQTTPEQVMDGWMNSAGHRANILNGSFTSIGVGHYQDASGVDYWTQLFIH